MNTSILTGITTGDCDASLMVQEVLSDNPFYSDADADALLMLAKSQAHAGLDGEALACCSQFTDDYGRDFVHNFEQAEAHCLPLPLGK